MEPYEMVGRFPSVQDYDARNQAYKANQLAMMLQRAQVDQIPLHNQMLQLQLAGAGLTNQTAQSRFALAQQILSGDQPQGAPQQAQTALANGAAQGSVGPTVANGNALSAMHQPSPAMSGLTFPRVVGMKLLGGPDMSADFKMGLEGVSHPAGQYVTGVDGRTTYLMDPKNGLTVDPTSQTVGVAPGAARSASMMASATKAGETAGANSQTMAPETRLGPDGKPLNQTVAQLIAGTGAPDPFQSSAPSAPASDGALPINELPSGPPTKTVNDRQVMTGNQSAAMADMAARGQDLSTMKVNGAPAFVPRDIPALTAELQAAQAKSPQAVQAYIAQHSQSIQNLPVAKRAQAMAGFQSFLQQHGASGASPFMGPAEAAAQKLAAEQGVHAETDPIVALRKNLVTESHTSNQKFMDNLGEVVNNEGEIVSRNTRLQPLLDQLPKLGGFAQDGRADFANKLKNSGLLPQATLDSLAGKIAGGDPDAAKVVQNQLSAAAIQTMLDTLNKEGKPNRVMYQALHEQQEGLAAGKPVLQGIMSLQNQLYQQHLQQLNSATDLMASPDYSPVKFQNQFATAKAKSIASPPTAATLGPKSVNFADLK